MAAKVCFFISTTRLTRAGSTPKPGNPPALRSRIVEAKTLFPRNVSFRRFPSGKAFYSILQFCYKLTDAKGTVRFEAWPCQPENAGRASSAIADNDFAGLEQLSVSEIHSAGNAPARPGRRREAQLPAELLRALAAPEPQYERRRARPRSQRRL